ncbi:TPA: HEPN domain-containing protein [Candidatus Poribacteria bacterium]|nr:HEPN domain-containing protein [Candidatus Poribacteria bacterium]
MAKSFLDLKDKYFEKTHNISYLLELCKVYGLEFEFLKDKAEIMTSYAVEIRYSLVSSDITLKEAQEAFDIAEIIYKFVKNLIKV